MQTQAWFENIQQHIIAELNAAQSSVIIAVAWFTDTDLLGVLCIANKGIKTVLLLVEEQLNMLKASETCKTIVAIDDWDEYFKTAKEKINERLKELETATA